MKGSKSKLSFLLKKNDIKKGDFQIRALEQTILGGRRPQLNLVGPKLAPMFSDLFWLSGFTGWGRFGRKPRGGEV